MNADMLQKRWARIRKDVSRQRTDFVNDELETMKREALRLRDELEDKFDDIVHHALQKIEQRQADRRHPIKRFVRRNRWLPVVAALGVGTAVVIATRWK